MWQHKEADDLAITSIPELDPDKEDSDFSTGYGEPRFTGAMRVVDQLNLRPCERFIDFRLGIREWQGMRPCSLRLRSCYSDHTLYCSFCSLYAEDGIGVGAAVERRK
jgi:hypothetical protein